jgi:hypothetical protein
MLFNPVKKINVFPAFFKLNNPEQNVQAKLLIALKYFVIYRNLILPLYGMRYTSLILDEKYTKLYLIDDSNSELFFRLINNIP